MKNKTMKNLLCLTAAALISGSSTGMAGCISSKPVVHTQSPAIDAEQMEIILGSKHLPWVSSDGGKAYFNAWNGMGKGKDFEFFLKECKEKIESLGGKVSSSVSKNTAFLVNNDITSSSSKNKKAKELGVPIITENQLLEMIQ